MSFPFALLFTSSAKIWACFALWCFGLQWTDKRPTISAKAAVEGLTVSLAAEFAPHIRVNCIAPSLTNSKIAEPMLKNKALADGIAKAHPLKRLGQGKDSASLAKFLITDDSSWVTGQVIAVDGGRSKLS